MVKSVVLSGRLHAVNLEPYFLYVMTPKEHKQYADKGGAKHDHLVVWLLSLGVRVVAHTVSFYSRKGMETQV